MNMTGPWRHRTQDWWTIDDLYDLPDDGMRYELIDGALLASPASTTRHARSAHRLRRLLERHAPDGAAVSHGGGVRINTDHTYFIPDLFLIPESSFELHPKYLLPAVVQLVVEVLSEHNRGRDLVLKRHYYAAAGIPRYWIVDPFERTLSVLALDGTTYRDEAVVKAGTTWTTDKPFPLKLDPAEFC